MKFGETFSEYLRRDHERFLDKCSHVEYKRLKKVLKKCRVCRAAQQQDGEEEEDVGKNGSLDLCAFESESCPLCDQIFFAELTKEASEIAGCFISRVRRLLHPSDSFGLQRYLWRLRQCFMDDQQIMVQEGRLLLDYITMNAIAIRKILKKYDKIHRSVNGRKFKTRMRAEHLELLQSPWLIELGAFYINVCGSNIGEPGEFFRMFSCDLCDTQPRMIMMLSDCVIYEYSLTCAICLDTVFNPYALGCGHLFCKGCACSAASVLLFQGLKTASQRAKCPVCREAGVYANAVHMTELDLLVKNRCKEYWKDRLRGERTEMVKQSKQYWESQTVTAFGY
ncbi:hypothetical protein J5N97_010852 [Dioscorea zingiberensis]|uniref:RING-type E3 ubiquitin transferase n=1 Tax=Dioscorea zingiberensis TaxID=325984 RepID=A0A9D5D134_9LILI|nr:hypothetical protein J5N97_010852 [Dioscorea zingiberensis]